jgi:hypothetical protein
LIHVFTCVAKGTSDWVDAVADHANSHDPFALRAGRQVTKATLPR